MVGAMPSFLTFREFPWPNGVILQGHHIEQDIATWLAEEPGQHPDIRRDLIQVSTITPNSSQLTCMACSVKLDISHL
jgi:hypothetical protein